MKRIKKPISILLSLILIFSVFTIIPVTTAGALTDVRYLDLEGNVQLILKVYELNSTALSTGMYAVKRDYDIGDRITVSGNVRLVLFNGVTLHARKGITVEEGGSLTIWQEMPEEGVETGKLIVDESDDNYAGIGCGPQGSGGNININGGIVTVTGGSNAAGIGGANTTVTINRGTVTATGGANAAGIGGTDSTVTINGGTVNAAGGANAAGISGTITLNNEEIPYGDISVTSDSYSGAVNLGATFFHESSTYPSGAVSDNSILAGKTLKALPWNIPYIDEDGAEQLLTSDDYTVITSGTSTLSTGWYVVMADVDNNNRLTVSGSVNLLIFNDTTFNAHYGITVNKGDGLAIYQQPEEENKETGKLIVDTATPDCAGIGGRTNNDGGSVTINGCIITVEGGANAAGIGGGYGYCGGIITINGGTVNATGGSDAAGIGGGEGGDGGTVIINGGTVNATGGSDAAGIGGGGSYRIQQLFDPGDGGTVVINGGTVSATGTIDSAGIGGGYRGKGGNITISGGVVTASGYTGMGCGRIFDNDYTGSVTLKWTEDTKRTMSVYASGCNVGVTLENDFKDENDTVYAVGSYGGGTIAGKTLTPFEPAEVTILGDADGSGRVDIMDATAIQRKLAGYDVASFNERAADSNGNGLDILDATSIQRYLAGYTDEKYAIGKPIE